MTGERSVPDPTSHGRFARTIERIADTVKTAVEDARARHRLSGELAELAGCGQLDNVLGEAGFSPGQVRRLIADHPRAPRLLQGMTDRLGIDMAEIQDLLLQRQIQRTCSLCAAQRRCRRWLRSGAKAGYREFCPNAELFDSMLGRSPTAATPEDSLPAMLPPDPAAEGKAEARRLGAFTQLPYI